MITVTFAQRGQKLALWVDGHAGYAEDGKDIVCASASILANTLASIVESLPVECSIRLDIGDTRIEAECDSPQVFSVVKNAFAFTAVGYALLQHTYPQYVSLNGLT